MADEELRRLEREWRETQEPALLERIEELRVRGGARFPLDLAWALSERELRAWEERRSRPDCPPGERELFLSLPRELELKAPTTVIRVAGSLGFEPSVFGRWRQGLEQALVGRASRLVLHVSEVTNWHSVCLGILLMVAKRLRQSGGQVLLTPEHSRLAEFIELMQFGEGIATVSWPDGLVR